MKSHSIVKDTAIFEHYLNSMAVRNLMVNGHLLFLRKGVIFKSSAYHGH